MKEIELDVKKIKGRVFISFPVDFWDPNETTKIKGYIFNGVLTVPLFSSIIGFSSKEIEVLKKLSSVKFEDRKLKKIEPTFSADEQKVLKTLLKKGVISIYSRGKYKNDPVYVIPNMIFSILQSERSKNNSSQKKQKTKELPDYLILSTQGEASKISLKYADEIKNGLLSGVRDFKDKNYYIVSKSFYDSYAPRISLILKSKPLSLSEIASSLKMNTLACKSILLLMGNKGEVYFKDGKYHLA